MSALLCVRHWMMMFMNIFQNLRALELESVLNKDSFFKVPIGHQGTSEEACTGANKVLAKCPSS